MFRISMVPRSARAWPGTLARFALVTLVGGASLGGAYLATPAAQTAEAATWWTWPTYPYQADSYGNYSYRDMEFVIGTPSGNWRWFNQMFMYTHIVAAPSFGYHYDAYIGEFLAPESSFAPAYDSDGIYVDYYSGLTYWYVDMSGDMYKYVYASSSLCEAGTCGALAMYETFGDMLRAYSGTGSTTASCWKKQFPTYYYC